jgi:hypothetical protein
MAHMLTRSKTWEQGKSATDAALDSDALFEPQLTGTILPNGTVDESSFTLYRELGNGEQVVLNAGVKEGYYAGSYLSLLNTAEAMFPESVTNMQTWDNGAVLVFTQDIEDEFSFGDGDSLTKHIMYTASLNSTYKTKAIGFTFRPFCTNQQGQGTLQIAQKRTRNHDGLLFQKAQVMSNYADAFDRFITNATMLKGLQMTNFLRNTILDKVAPLIVDADANTKAVNAAEKRRDGIMYYYEEEANTFGHNAYSLYQAVQSYEFHVGTKGKSKQLKQVNVVSDPSRAQSLTIQTGEMLLASV